MISALSGAILLLICGGCFGYGTWEILFLRGLLAFMYLKILIMMAFADRNTGMIRNDIHIGIALLGAAALWLFPEHDVTERLAGFMVVSVPMLLLTLIMKEAFGGGDIKLMAVSGFLLGWKAVLAAAVISFLAGGIYCAWMLAKKKLSYRDSFAFGPFLALGLGTAFFCGDFLVQWYFGT